MTQDPALPDDAGETPGRGVPLYLQVASNLRTAIRRQIYPVGSRMPTEEALCARFKVSRHTIREALRELRAEGVITSSPGSRPIVATPQPRPPEVVVGDLGKDFFDYTIGTRLEIAETDTVALTPSMAEATGLPAGQPWLRVTGYRIGIDDGRPTCWNEYFIRDEFALVGRLLARHVGPLIPLLEDLFEERITRITRSMSAVRMPEEQARRFGLEEGAPALYILVRCEVADGRLAMVNRSFHPEGVLSYTIRR